MLKCRELSRLTKVSRFTSILVSTNPLPIIFGFITSTSFKWRNQTPGSPQSVLDNSYLYLARNARSPSNPTGSSTSKATTLLDPFHPATKLKPHQIPSWQASGIKVRLVPMALLQKPEPMFKYELGNRRLPAHRSALQGTLAPKKLARRIPMSYLTATSKERMGSKRYMRRRITTRIKTALNLIVTRGAYVDQTEIQNGTGQLKEDGSEIRHNPSPCLKFDNEEASVMGEKWIMQGTVHRYVNLICSYTIHLGWSYIFYPTTQVYNMPYPILVTLLRQGLQSLYKSATKLERQWFKEASLTQPPPRPRRNQTDPSRTNNSTQVKLTKPAIKPSTHGQKYKTVEPRPSPDSVYGGGEKPQEAGLKNVCRCQIKSPTAVKPELWETQLRLGLATMQERLRKRR